MVGMNSAATGIDGQLGVAERFLDRAVEAQRAVARAQAAQAAVLAEAHEWAVRVPAAVPGASSRGADLEIRDLAARLGAALRVSDRTVQAQMDAATTLASLFPATLAAWSEGRIDRLHVTAIVEAGSPLTDEPVREWFEERALVLAEELTAAQLRPAVRTLAEHAHPESLTDRHARARARRRVCVTDLDDGMARLVADLPAPLAYGIRDRLTALAHEVAAATSSDDADADGDEVIEGDHATSPGHLTSPDRADAAIDARTIDELRADVFCDLLLSGAPAGHGDGLEQITGHVQITVPVLTVLGESNEPCLLAGHGPIPLDLALRLAGAATGWDRVMTHPVDGGVLAVGRPRPSEQLRRLLRARDERCRFVGCRQPAWHCDADHTIDHAFGGETSEHNLALLCRRHHVLKHQTAWSVQQLGRGRLRWTSPAGRAYVDRPEPTVRFVGDADPPPF